MNKFNSIFYYRSKDGQKKDGVNKTPDCIDAFMNKNIIRYNVPTTDSLSLTENLFYNLTSLYNCNEKVLGPRINLGGDHSMAIATVAYSLNQCDNLKVIWIDAHADINTFQESKSKNYHGMPLSFLTGLDYEKNFHFMKNKLDFKNLLYIGIRDLDKFEKEIIKSKDIKFISVNDINNKNNDSLQLIRQFIGNSKVHISFDVDSIDPSLIPCTGTSVDDGMLLEPTKNLFNFLINENDVINFDITEVNLKEGTFQQKIITLQSLFDILHFLL
jgi:arginase